MAFLLLDAVSGNRCRIPGWFYKLAPIIKERQHLILDLDQGMKKKVKFLYNLFLLEYTPEK